VLIVSSSLPAHQVKDVAPPQMHKTKSHNCLKRKLPNLEKYPLSSIE
jgi:hypothetical protein